MNKNFKCVIFDLDGTLINSGPDLLNSLNHVLAKNNLEKIDKNVIGNLVGGGAEAMIKKGYTHLNANLDEKKIPFLVNLFINHYYKNCTKETTLYDGVLDILKFLKKKTYICLCTNKKQFLAERILEELEIKKFFNYILGSDGKTPLKPEIEMPKKCLDKFRVAANQVVFVGDSDNDILPAKQLGMFSVHVTYGYGKLQEKINSDLVIEKIKDLRKIF
tara:strand:- start:18 stop:671 length:654 start_codon:yes stop_codon:yes gene_type:complete